MHDLTIGSGTQVTLYFSLALEDGEVIDSNFERDPAIFSVGDGSLLPGFEQSLFGLKAGDQQTLSISPEKGFGEHNPNNLQTISKDEFPSDITLEEGLMLSFADAQGGELPGVVVEFDDKEVTVDFNHPLAGRDIVFKVHIIDVEPAVTH